MPMTPALVPALVAAMLGQPALPERTGAVNDLAGVISPDREVAIERIIEEVRARSGGEIVVVTLDSLAGRSAEETALRLRVAWGVGRGGPTEAPARGVGVILLVVPAPGPADRDHIEIETGLRASAFISTAEVTRITNTHLLPAFRDGDYGTGILEGVAAIAVEYAEQFGFELTGDPPGPPAETSAPPSAPAIVGIILAAVALLGILLVLSRHPRSPNRPATDENDS